MTNERDDMNLTAYATGELDDQQRKGVEARLAGDVQARTQVGVIRKVIALLLRAFQGESAPHLAASQRTAIEDGSRSSSRRWWALGAGLAAAAILVVAGLLMFGPGGADDSSGTGIVKGRSESPAGEPDGPKYSGSLRPKGGKDVSGEDRVPLRISLPDPVPGGTPAVLKNEPNLTPYIDRDRPPFFAPKGMVNLAKGKPVTSSDSQPTIGNLTFVTDGDKKGGDGYFVELAPGKQHVTIDLQQEGTIYAVTVWHFFQAKRAYRDVVVQVSTDRDFIDCKTVFNNDHDNSSGHGAGKDRGYVEDHRGKLVDCKGVRGRYVRLWSREHAQGESNTYIEVEVYGRPVTGE